MKTKEEKGGGVSAKTKAGRAQMKREGKPIGPPKGDLTVSEVEDAAEAEEE
jgi:hypothetical protein